MNLIKTPQHLDAQGPGQGADVTEQTVSREQCLAKLLVLVVPPFHHGVDQNGPEDEAGPQR